MDVIENESLLLYDICCSIGISSSEWKKDIQLSDFVTTLNNLRFTIDSNDPIIMCGSRSEGIQIFPIMAKSLGISSDIDLMHMLGGINVQEHVDTTHTNQAKVLQLHFTDSPEHVLLEVRSYESALKTFGNTPLCWIKQVIKRKHRKFLVSSSLLKDYVQGHFSSIRSFKNVRHATVQVHPVTNTTIHGPAVMVEKGPIVCSLDSVYCFNCNEWPTAAQEWIRRARRHGWPSQDLIDQIKNDGCELVPVGRTNHSDEDVEWKLSFSRAETRLIRSFNIYQAQCYQLLKIVKTYFISSVVADSLSSYHIKTVMLHTVEQTEPKVWRKDNLAQCFGMCLSNLKRYLTDKFLPQYFIVRQNLLEPKVTGDVLEKVLGIVTDLDKIGWKCLLQCPVLQDLYRSIQEPGGSFLCNFYTDFLGLEGNIGVLGNYFSALLSDNLTQVDPVSYYCYLIRIVVFCEKTLLKPTSIHPSVETARVLQLLRKGELGFLLTVIRAMAYLDHRPGIEPMMNFARQCLEESCHADVTSCRLKLTTFYFHMGEYNRCIATVQDVLERFKEVWVVVGGLDNNFDERRETLRNMDTSKIERYQALQLSDNGFPFISNHLSLPVIFKRWEVAVAPKGVHFLQKEMSRRKGLFSEVCCIDSIVYAHYLLLESYLKIDEYDLAEHALINMKESILNRKDYRFDRNCLCYCEEDNVLLHYSADRVMKEAKNVKERFTGDSLHYS